MATTKEGISVLLTKKDGEFLRMVASVSVVVAHCIHFWVERFYHSRNLLSVDYLCAFLDQATRFTVPLFFFLSGFGLTLQFMERPTPLAKYYRYRLPKILAPFLVWSALTGLRHDDYLAALPWTADPAGALGTLLRFLFVDGFDYQYYFLIVIFQFYLVYPFVYRLGRSKIWLGIFLAVHMSFLSPVEAYLEPFGLEIPKLHSNFLLFHWFYCFAGVYAAWNRRFLLSLAERWGRRKVVLFWVLVFAVTNLEFLGNIANDKYLWDLDHFNRWSVVLYCMACLMLFIVMKPRIEAGIHANPRFAFLFTHVAPYTFFVYLAHTHVLRAVDFLFWEVTVFDLLNRTILVVVGSYFLAWTAQWLLEDFPLLRFCFGLPKKPAMDWSGVPGLSRLRLRARMRNSGMTSRPARPGILEKEQRR
ncbi:MAG TPA: acyltransferase [Fibrobacteria bacterium]|nr:acyltransferase [Fibrobacteria bacterium]